MTRTFHFSFVTSIVFQFFLSISMSLPSFAQEWEVRRPRGILKVVALGIPSASISLNYAEGLVTRDRGNNFIPCLAKDWGWIDDRTMEFKLRKDATFHNGEQFNAEAVRINWEGYKG